MRRNGIDAHHPRVTPKYRQNLYHYVGVGLMLLALVGLGLGTRGDNRLLTAVGVTAVIAFLVLAGLSIADSRCPYCGRFIDLRGPGAYCPRCGEWLALHDGDAPPGGR